MLLYSSYLLLVVTPLLLVAMPLFHLWRKIVFRNRGHVPYSNPCEWFRNGRMLWNGRMTVQSQLDPILLLSAPALEEEPCICTEHLLGYCHLWFSGIRSEITGQIRYKWQGPRGTLVWVCDLAAIDSCIGNLLYGLCQSRGLRWATEDSLSICI